MQETVYSDVNNSGVATLPRRQESKESNYTREYVLANFGEGIYDLIYQYNEISELELDIATTTRFNILKYQKKFRKIVNLKRLNDVRYLNKFFEVANDSLFVNGYFIGFAETKEKRKERIRYKYPPILNLIYYGFDYLVKRVWPKLPMLKKIYFAYTKGNNRVISRAEILGRLYSCGFTVEGEEYKDSDLFFVARKTRAPAYDISPTYGPLIKLRRIGKGGRLINIYKFRTMHPYSEYLQDYVYKLNSLQEGGKFKDDFRVSTVGRFLRKTWLDELPMLINLLKGDLKLFGVRPLSSHYFGLYTRELQEKRVKHKPGLIPPFYVDLPKDLDGIMKSELDYLNKYEKSPIKTDIVYLAKAIWNILKGARSN